LEIINKNNINEDIKINSINNKNNFKIEEQNNSTKYNCSDIYDKKEKNINLINNYNILKIEKENEILLSKLQSLENQTIPHEISELKCMSNFENNCERLEININSSNT
jgi:hypothetical protein